MGQQEGNGSAGYSQLASEEQSIGSEERQFGNGDHLCENESGLFYNTKELAYINPLRDRATCAQDGTRRYRYFIVCVTVLTLLFSILQLLALFRGELRIPLREDAQIQPPGRQEEEMRLLNSEWPCGISAEEAKKAGCHFDLGLIAWLPHSCYNKELDESFRTLYPWKFWLPNDEDTGPNTTKPITIERLQDLPLQMVDLDWPGHSWSTLMFHDAHCLHAWQYMHQALLKNKEIPTSITRWSHTTHCSHEALMDTSNVTYREISPTAHNRYPACVQVESLRGEMPDLY